MKLSNSDMFYEVLISSFIFYIFCHVIEYTAGRYYNESSLISQIFTREGETCSWFSR